MVMHDDQIDVTVGTVRRLVARQYPQWSDRPVHRLRTAGTVNAIFRLGDDLCGRFPLRASEPEAARDWLRVEATAAAEFAEVSSVPSPVTLAIGEPADGYPMPWTVQTWVAGEDATISDATGSDAFAIGLATLIAALRTADSRGRRFGGQGRGGHLPDHDQWIETCLRNSEGLLDVGPLCALWAEFRGLPELDTDAMCHGDLTPPNVLVQNGQLVGVLDCGGFGPADPALDLVSAWHLLDGPRRESLRDVLGCGEMQWRRGKAWAFQQAMGLVWYYAESNPVMSAWGRRTLGHLLAERH